VIVTEWVDGASFEQVAERDEPTRDRFAEIVYRFFYATASELHLALGDPHPGNYLLCDDGRVGFFDFGMLRRLPQEYLLREARVFQAIRQGDGGALVQAMRELGYLPGPSAEWNAELLLEHMRLAGWWFADDEPRRLAPEDLWRGTESLRTESGEQMIGQLRRMTLPAEALLLRRMEGLLFQIACTVRAEVAWGPLLRELIEGGESATELGEQHRHWLAERTA
jgi:hypothetical protein